MTGLKNGMDRTAEEGMVKAGDMELAEDHVYCSAPAIVGKPGLLKVEELCGRSHRLRGELSHRIIVVTIVPA